MFDRDLPVASGTSIRRNKRRALTNLYPRHFG
jgi:hypothetical protein